MDSMEWGGDLPGVAVREVPTAAAVDPARGRQAWTASVIALGDLLEAERALAKHVPDGAVHRLEQLESASVVTLIAALQDVRRSLAQTEAWLTRTVGMDETAVRQGLLPDGRQFTVRRGNSRKAWEHDEWKADVRAQVLSGVGALVDAATGEEVDAQALLAAVQDVQGAGAPKVTALRALGLDPDDYCESVPGTWSVEVVGDSEAP